MNTHLVDLLTKDPEEAKVFILQDFATSSWIKDAIRNAAGATRRKSSMNWTCSSICSRRSVTSCWDSRRTLIAVSDAFTMRQPTSTARFDQYLINYRVRVAQAQEINSFHPLLCSGSMESWGVIPLHSLVCAFREHRRPSGCPPLLLPRVPCRPVGMMGPIGDRDG